MRLSIVGLGKLGSPMAAVLAEKGHEVVGVDANPEAVRALNEGRAPVEETELQDYITRNRERLSATEDPERAVRDTECTFIIVPTPSVDDGEFSMRYVLSAAEPIARALREKSDYHLVVLSSTVMPGASATELLPRLEALSGKRAGVDFGFCYNPEFIALGSVIRDFLHPDMVLIGEHDARSGDLLEKIHRSLVADVPVQRMSLVNAELTKLSVNTFVTTKISYANMLAEVCEQFDGADVDVVTGALGLDSRIGGKYLKGALGYGGPCFPRDNVAFAALSRRRSVDPALAESTDRVNRRQPARIAERMLAALSPGETAAVLGLAYKTDTAIIEQSQGVMLIDALLEGGARVLAHDPQALDAARKLFGDRIEYADSAAACLAAADVAAFTVPWAEYSRLTPRALKNSRTTIIDCWRVLPRELFEGSCNYAVVGSGSEPKTRPVGASV